MPVIDESHRTPNTKCFLCGTGLYKSPNLLLKKKNFSCSKCKGEARRQYLAKNPKQFSKIVFLAQKRKGLSIYPEKYRCPDCGGKKGFSSNRCINCAFILRRGENNSNWKGGITPKVRIERTIFGATVGKEVLKRDNYTCQMCGKRGKYLHVDHIEKWSDSPEKRFSPDNCRTLCVDCHYLITWEKKRPHRSQWGIRGGQFV